jgi:uncharacterized membrane protein
MDTLKLHILFNYYPAIGIIIGTLLLAAGLWFRKARWKRFSLKLFVFLAILTFFVALAGEVSSRATDWYSGPRGAALTGHRHFATLAFVVTAITGITALIGLVRSSADSDRGNVFYTVVLVLAIASSMLLVATILKGRQVKWVVAVPSERSKVLVSIDTEKKLWHV